ncbi:NusG domain II-containing protein [Murdochiella vaginalis]|uniref:NusG domain II-containing protein n=1 Tax=Murdochiella vaginalis TaxID=1852373 RepID=UPI0008FD9CF5|nr:NusG domain II-containing protein [Murdochiella vaginalis]
MKKRWTTRADRVLILLLALASVIALGILFFGHAQTKQDVYVSIQVDGKEIDRYALAEAEGQTKRYTSAYGCNVVKIEQGSISVFEADCPDKLCMHQGRISRPGQILVCLPNRFLVELMGGAEQASDVDAYLQ